MRHSFLLATLVLVLLGLSTVPAAAHTTTPRGVFRVVVVDRLDAAEWQSLAARGAVGLLVPGVGPTTSRRRAVAGLARGATFNSNRAGTPGGPWLVPVTRGLAATDDSPVIIVTLPVAGPTLRNDRRYRIAVIGGGFHGLLRSPTTRIDGLVSLADVAPTALGRQRGALTSVAAAQPVAHLARLDAQIHANNRLKLPALIVIACALLLIAAIRPRAAIPAILGAFVASIAVGALAVANEPLIMVLLVGGIGAGVVGARWLDSGGRLLAAITGVLVLHLLLFVVHPDWVALSPLGPTQNSRFWGVGNQLETLLLAPILVGALLAYRRYGSAGFAAFSLLALALVTDNRLGSDGGGAIVVGVALAVLGARVLRLGMRGFTSLLLVAATIVLAIVSFNLHTPGPDHLRSAFDHGFSGLLAVAANRVPLSYLPALHAWPLVLPLAIWLVAVFAFALRTAERAARDLVLATGLAIVASLLVNDSAAYELAGGVAVVAAVARHRSLPRGLLVPASAALPFRPQPVANEAAQD